MSKIYDQALEAKQFIESKVKITPKIGMILGSGLGNLVDQMTDVIDIKFQDIPHFKETKAEGHQGVLSVGFLNGVGVVALKGRYHYYEGHTLSEVVFPVRVMKLLGVEKLIITNSCGAVNIGFKPGELMLITDHLNLTANNPLIGDNVDEFGPRFPDASEIYTKALRKIAVKEASNLNIKLNQGVYAWWTGPSYETPADIRMIRTLGADAIGMSTVPESLTASHMGMQVLGISCLTNMASGVLDQKLSHQEVLDVAQKVNKSFSSLVIKIISNL